MIGRRQFLKTLSIMPIVSSFIISNTEPNNDNYVSVKYNKTKTLIFPITCIDKYKISYPVREKMHIDEIVTYKNGYAVYYINRKISCIEGDILVISINGFNYQTA